MPSEWQWLGGAIPLLLTGRSIDLTGQPFTAWRAGNYRLLVTAKEGGGPDGPLSHALPDFAVAIPGWKTELELWLSEVRRSMPFIHELADVQSDRIGANTRIGQFVVVQPGAVIGDNCNVCAQAFVGSAVVIGNQVTVRPGVHLSGAVLIEDKVTIGPNVTCANDRVSGNDYHLDLPGRTIFRNGASIGAGAVILPDIEIGEWARVEAGAILTRSVPPNAVVAGNPARVVGYVNAIEPSNHDLPEKQPAELLVGVHQTGVSGVTQHRFPFIKDLRGDLTVGEFEKTVPFIPKRYFLILNVPGVELRGEHAHRECHQFLICVRGSCAIVADDGTHRQELLLDRPDIGIYLPPMVWGVQYKYSSDAVLLVFASHYYDAKDYIRDYSDFRHLLKAST